MAAAAPGGATVLVAVVLISAVIIGGAAAQSCSSSDVVLPKTVSTPPATIYLTSPRRSDGPTPPLRIPSLSPSPRPAPETGWAAWAINPISGGGMLGARSLIALRESNGSFSVQTYNITTYDSVSPSAIDYKVSELEGDHTGGMMRIFAKVVLPPGTTKINQVWQVGNSLNKGLPVKHAFGPDNLAAKGTIDLLNGQSSGSGDPRLKKKNIHGVLNAVSWGILLPMGASFARYLKTFESADPAWFYIHVGCQLIGYGLGVAGWATGLNLGSKSKGVTYPTHRNIGITLFALATLQLFALFLRPKKDNKYRFYWNIYHHSVGYTVIVLGIVNVLKGLDILTPAQKWKTAYIVAICILGGIAVAMEAVRWGIALRRRNENKTSKPYDGSHASNARNGVQQPLHV